jgi:hypothetical protein
MIRKLLSYFFKTKPKENGQAMHSGGQGRDNAQEAKEVVSKPTKIKAMKKAKPNLPASAMLKSPASSGKAVVKKAAKKAVTDAVMKKAAKKKY